MLKYAYKNAKFNLVQRFLLALLSVVPSIINILLVMILIDNQVKLIDILYKFGGDKTEIILSEFSCPLNSDVEDFID